LHVLAQQTQLLLLGHCTNTNIATATKPALMTVIQALAFQMKDSIRFSFVKIGVYIFRTRSLHRHRLQKPSLKRAVGSYTAVEYIYGSRPIEDYHDQPKTFILSSKYEFFCNQKMCERFWIWGGDFTMILGSLLCILRLL